MVYFLRNTIPGFLLLLPAFALTQLPLRVLHWGVKQGLSTGSPTSFHKDINGFLWIGSSSGLNRFNGHSFTYYFHEPGNKNSICDNYITNLVEDSLHNIWIGTANGYCRYDIQTDSILNFEPGKQKGNTNTSVYPFWATENEIFCIEPAVGITATNIRNYAKRILTTRLPAKIINDQVKLNHSIYDSVTNSIYLVDGTLLQYNLSDDKEYKYTADIELECMILDRKRNCIWLGDHRGLSQFHPGNKQFTRITAVQPLTEVNWFDEISGLTFDQQGQIWLSANYSKGPARLGIYHPETQLLDTTSYSKGKRNSISSEIYGILYGDKDGMIWAGKYDLSGFDQLTSLPVPVTRITPEYFNHQGNETHFITSLAKAGQNKIWVGSNNGIDELDLRTNTFNHLLGNKPPDKGNKFITALLVDTLLQKSWYALAGSVFEWDMKTGKQTKIEFKDSAGREIYSFTRPSLPTQNATELFIIYGNAVFNLKKGNTTATRIIDKGNIFITLFAMPDPANAYLKLFPSGSNQSYALKENSWSISRSMLDSLEWSSCYFDPADGSMWLGGNTRVSHFDKHGQLLKLYGKFDGLPEAYVLGILKDNSNSIWINTNHEICRLDLHTNNFIRLSTFDGLEKQEFGWATPILNAGMGNLFFGGPDGIDWIRPSEIFSYPPPTPYLETLEVNREQIDPVKTNSDDYILDLPYFKNDIRLETGIIDYYAYENARIRYRMEGKESKEEWKYSSPNAEIQYFNLKPGKYTLKIQAFDGGNKWENSAITLIINISAAFWDHWWFQVPLLLLFLYLLYVLVRIRLKNKYTREKERLEKENELAHLKRKAIELELQALHAQINPHFIFNSLNSINLFILRNDAETASDYLTKFSKLVRMVLINSEKQSITLEDELEALDLYINLEILRFKQPFAYSLKIQPEINPEELFIPPLIIQPFVENAIWHGLMNKKTKGSLLIEIFTEPGVLCCRITDDGIGRQKSGEQEVKSDPKQKSMGLRITRERLALLNGESFYEIEDLKDEEGNSIGTQVTLKLNLSNSESTAG